MQNHGGQAQETTGNPVPNAMGGEITNDILEYLSNMGSTPGEGLPVDFNAPLVMLTFRTMAGELLKRRRVMAATQKAMNLDNVVLLHGNAPA